MPSIRHASGQDFVGLIHAFGVLRTDSTPCGQPMSVSTAHAICELATVGALHQNDLAHRLGLTTSSISRLVDQLVLKKWATRQPDPQSNDKRIRLVTLSESGSKVADEVLAARSARFEQLLQAIDPNKHDQVLESLHLLKEAANAIR